MRVWSASGGGVPPPRHHSIHQMKLPLKYLHSKNISINRTKIFLLTRDSWQDEKSIWQQLYYYVCCIFNSSLKCCFSIYRVWDKNQFQKLFLKQSFITLSQRHKPKAHLIIKYHSKILYHDIHFPSFSRSNLWCDRLIFCKSWWNPICALLAFKMCLLNWC